MQELLIKLIIVGLLCGVSYYGGKHNEQSVWKARVAEVQKQLDDQKKVADEKTTNIVAGYEDTISTINKQYGTKLANKSSVRVLNNTCPSQDGVTEQAVTITPTSPELASETITEKEWEDENRRRFEDNKAQLESLINFINTLYSSYR